MKLAHAEKSVVGSHGLGDTKAFSIRTNAHAFKMLSSGLYSDKVRAVLREIGCNAYDAHVAAGCKDRPFEVKLPNRIDAQFYIKDFGTGLSHAEVMDLYTSYFSSTKQTSNDFTGAFGLGSKSPFSYTDSFTVTSSHGGKKRTYSAHLDNSGTPTVALLTEEDADADWPTGVMVGFHVPPTAFNEFTSKANEVFCTFATVPKFIGAPQVSPMDKMLVRPTFFRSPAHLGMHVHVLMGNVMYPVSVSRVNGMANTPSAYIYAFRGIVLIAPIGAVQVAASREELQYDEATCAWLTAAMSSVVVEFGKDAVKVCNSMRSAKWDDKASAKADLTEWTSGNYIDFASVLQGAGVKNGAMLAPTLHGTGHHMAITLDANVNVVHIVKNSRDKFSTIKLTPDTLRNLQVKYGKLAILAGKATASVLRGKAAIDAGADTAMVITAAKTAPKGSKVVDRTVDMICKDLGYDVANVTDLASAPLPTWHAPAKHVKNKSSRIAQSSPIPPALELTAIEVDSGTAVQRKPGKEVGDIAYFVAGYGPNGGVYRLFDETIEKDKWLTMRDWGTIRNDLAVLSESLVNKPTQFVYILSADQARSLAVKKRPEWKWATTAISEWAKQKGVVDEIAAIAGRWKPTIDLQRAMYHPTWLEYLSLKMKDKLAPDVEQVLKDAGMLTPLTELVTESIKVKQWKHTCPEVLSAYETLIVSPYIDAPQLNVKLPRSFLTPEALLDSWKRKFPLMETFDPSNARSIEMKNPAKLAQFLKMIFST